MARARWAYLSVESVSGTSPSLGEMQANIAVLALPPSEPWSKCVSFDSRYGPSDGGRRRRRVDARLPPRLGHTPRLVRL